MVTALAAHVDQPGQRDEFWAAARTLPRRPL
jgi:hypothetical protein